MLYTILHSSVVLFTCGIANLVLRTHVTLPQFAGALTVALGLLTTTIPGPLEARRSFTSGAVTALLGAICLAAAYPATELCFHLCRRPPREEEAAFYGALVNVVIGSAWTFAYTVPRWDSLVVAPIYAADVSAPSVPWAVGSYALHSVLVGAHSLAFFKSVHRLGSVPTAIAKGAQQAGSILFAHLFFCHVDKHECIWPRGPLAEAWWRRWAYWQKSVAVLLCCAGCVIYILHKPHPPGASTVSRGALSRHRLL